MIGLGPVWTVDFRCEALALDFPVLGPLCELLEPQGVLCCSLNVLLVYLPELFAHFPSLVVPGDTILRPTLWSPVVLPISI
jgi:hypothetical protein